MRETIDCDSSQLSEEPYYVLSVCDISWVQSFCLTHDVSNFITLEPVYLSTTVYTTDRLSILCLEASAAVELQ